MPSLATDQAIEMARAQHAAGRIAEAEKIVRQLLAVQPRDPRALHLLGSISAKAGRYAEAAQLFRLAIDGAPRDAALRHDLALALAPCGHLAQAIAECRQALAIASNFFDAWQTLGNLFRAQGNPVEALRCFRQALALFPERADAYINPAAVLVELKQCDEAASLLQHAIEVQPDLPQAHHNLGIVLEQLGKLDEAIVSLRRALALRPGHHTTLYVLANVLLRSGQFDQSVRLCRESIRLRSDFPDAHLTLGNGLFALNRFDEATPCYRNALALKPNWAAAHGGLAGVQVECGQIEQAIRSYRQAIQSDPTGVNKFSSLLLCLNYQSSISSREIFHEHGLFNLTHAAVLERNVAPHSNDRSADRRLRIGYVSPDFREHAASFFSLPLLAHHDPARFEIYCYANVNQGDAVTERFRNVAGVWRRIWDLSDGQAAAMIREDRIDILVDLALHSAGGRPLLFARRPAPIQVAWLGYPGTTGLTAVDYRLTDAHIDPPHGQSYYFEESIRLPDTSLCYDPRATEPAVNALPATNAGLVTFGCLNHFKKVSELTLRMWAGVLDATPHSRLLMAAPRGSSRKRTMAFFRDAGINSDRIEFIDRQPNWRQLIEVYHRIDISLDTFPWNGHTTSFESLWMGVPVVTLTGQAAISRAGLCYLSNLNLPELAAETPERYVQIAAQLASDLPRLAELRATLRQRLLNSPLTDAKRFAENVESAYRQMWQKWIQMPISDDRP